MRAIGNYIVITPAKLTVEKTEGGLLLADKDKENIRYKEATVDYVSEDIQVIQPGDKILYDKAAGFGIEPEGKKYTVIKLQDIAVIL
jgi:co-chaperonin GroES (HSP10)